MNKNKIKSKILFPVVGAISISIIVLYVVNTQLINFTINENSQKKLEAISKVLRSHRAKDVKMLTNSIFILQKNRELQKHWLSKDRKQLYKEAKKLYSNLNSSFDITHFYFHDTNSINFLRVHKPEKYGDYIDRFTMKIARESKIISSGLEVGPLGTFTLRVVAPWYINGKLEGYIELGEEIEHQIDNLNKVFNIELYVMLNKKFVSKQIYERGLKQLDREGSWGNYKDYALIYKTSNWVPKNLEDIIHKTKNEIIKSEHEDKTYMAKSFILHDASLRDVAKIIVLLDVSAPLEATTFARIIAFLIITIIGVLIVISFYFILGRIEKNILSLSEKVISESKLRELEQEVHIRELEKDSEKLKASEKKFRVIFENAQNAITWVNPKTRLIINCNNAAVHLFKYSKKELIGKPRNILFAKEKKEYYLKKYSEYFRKHTTMVDEAELETKDGKLIIAQISASIISIEGSEIIQGTYIDITEQKEAAQILATSEAQLRAVSENSIDAIFWADSKTNLITDCNKAAETLLETSMEEIIGRTLISIHPERKQAEYLKKFMEQMVEYGYLDTDAEIKTKTGKIKFVHISASITIVNDEAIVHGTFHDITTRKLNEERIKESEEKNRSLLEALPDILFVFDKNGVFLDYHSRSGDDLAAPPEAFLGKNINEVFPPNIADITKENITKTLSNNKMNIFRYSISHSDKVFNEEARMVRYSEDKVLVMIRDISDILEAENKLVEAKERAEKADSLKSTFLAQMSHEIRTPINSMVSLSSLVEEELIEHADDDIKTCFSLIRKSGDRIVRTTDLILNLSEIEAGTYEVRNEEFNLVDSILQKLFNEYSLIAKKNNIEIEFESNLPNPIVTADSYTIEQIFSNLIDNAVKYTDKGKITIRAFNNKENKVTVEIIDTGIGIVEEYLPKLFVPFSQEMMGYTRKYEGNGVGLALVREYCKLNNAIVEVESVKDVGSTFRVVFL